MSFIYGIANKAHIYTINGEIVKVEIGSETNKENNQDSSQENNTIPPNTLISLIPIETDEESGEKLN